jgi:D-alanyl-D-alanine carboxypeptidase
MRHTQRPSHTLPRLLVAAIAFMTVLILLAPQLGEAAPRFAWTGIDQQLRQAAPASNMLVAEFAGNGCQTIHGVNADEQLAIASVFKLYVLGELARQIQVGDVRWDEPITLTDDLRSMPSIAVGPLHLPQPPEGSIRSSSISLASSASCSSSEAAT